MKKLMVAAAIAASAIAANAGCGLPTAPGGCVPPVWDFQMMLRADTLCVRLGEITDAGHCGIAGNTVCGCYRDVQTLNYAGGWYICDCGCDKMADGIFVDMADMTRRIKYADGALQPSIAGSLSTTAITWVENYRVGAYAGKMAGIATLAFGNASSLQLAGFGSFPLNATYFQTFAGYATGVIDASPSCGDSQVGGTYCGIYDLCNPGVVANNPATWPAPDESKATAVAYGQFQVKFNAAASARLAATYDYDQAGGYNVSTIMPAWFLR